MKRNWTLRFAVFLSLAALWVASTVLKPAVASDLRAGSYPMGIQNQPPFQHLPGIQFFRSVYFEILLPDPLYWILTGSRGWKPNPHDLFNVDPDPRDVIRNCGGDDGFAPSQIKKP